MEEIYIDLSDKIFIHKDFVEIVTKGTTLSEALEQYIFDEIDKIDKVIIFQISIWQGVRLESIFISPEDLKVMLESKTKVVGLEYY